MRDKVLSRNNVTGKLEIGKTHTPQQSPTGVSGWRLINTEKRGSCLSAQSNGTTSGAIRTYSTISSIGVERDLAGDADHDATATVEYRAVGITEWGRLEKLVVRLDVSPAS